MKEKVKFFVEPRGFLTQTAAILMVIAAVLRLIDCWGTWDDKVFLYVQIVLPVCCAMIFAAVLLTLGKAAFWASFLPVALGAVTYIAESLGYASWLDAVLCILLSLLTAAVYSATAFGRIRTKWIGAAVYALLIAYVFFIRDKELLSTLATAPASTVLKELALLCALMALLFTALSIHKRKLPAPLPEDLPKIEDPVIIPHGSNAELSTPPAQTEASAAVPETENTEPPQLTGTGDAT